MLSGKLNKEKHPSFRTVLIAYRTVSFFPLSKPKECVVVVVVVRSIDFPGMDHYYDHSRVTVIA